jgi:hypothetical protein|tara:strand:+ start:623 stop:1000 length:378 start_codon:yes stop_codon:yes gene_type:complete
MTGLIRMNAEQMRRKGLENAEAKRQREKDYINQMEKMSKHDVGGLYDIRAIAKSKQFKEQKNYYDPHQAEKEFSDMLQSYGMFGESQKWIDYIKESGKSIDSFQLRLLGKRLSDMIETMKAKDNN